MKIDMVKYYYKCPTTGVEMSFSKTDQWGWGVCFTNIDPLESICRKDIHVPWPSLTEEEQKVIDENYKNLYDMIREEDENEEFQCEGGTEET